MGGQQLHLFRAMGSHACGRAQGQFWLLPHTEASRAGSEHLPTRWGPFSPWVRCVHRIGMSLAAVAALSPFLHSGRWRLDTYDLGH